MHFKILNQKKNLRIIDASNFQMSEILKINSQDEYVLIQFDDKKNLKKKILKLFQRKNQLELN